MKFSTTTHGITLAGLLAAALAIATATSAVLLVGAALSLSRANLLLGIGASLVVACDDGTVVVNSLKAGHSAIHLQCVQSKMVVVRDHHVLENVPALKRINLQNQ